MIEGISITQSKLASLFGVSRRTVNRSIAVLKQANLLDVHTYGGQNPVIWLYGDGEKERNALMSILMAGHRLAVILYEYIRFLAYRQYGTRADSCDMQRLMSSWDGKTRKIAESERVNIADEQETDTRKAETPRHSSGPLCASPFSPSLFLPCPPWFPPYPPYIPLIPSSLNPSFPSTPPPNKEYNSLFNLRAQRAGGTAETGDASGGKALDEENCIPSGPKSTRPRSRKARLARAGREESGVAAVLQEDRQTGGTASLQLKKHPPAPARSADGAGGDCSLQGDGVYGDDPECCNGDPAGEKRESRNSPECLERAIPPQTPPPAPSPPSFPSANGHNGENMKHQPGDGQPVGYAMHMPGYRPVLDHVRHWSCPLCGNPAAVFQVRSATALAVPEEGSREPEPNPLSENGRDVVSVLLSVPARGVAYPNTRRKRQEIRALFEQQGGWSRFDEPTVIEAARRFVEWAQDRQDVNPDWGMFVAHGVETWLRDPGALPERPLPRRISTLSRRNGQGGISQRGRLSDSSKAKYAQKTANSKDEKTVNDSVMESPMSDVLNAWNAVCGEYCPADSTLGRLEGWRNEAERSRWMPKIGELAAKAAKFQAAGMRWMTLEWLLRKRDGNAKRNWERLLDGDFDSMLSRRSKDSSLQAQQDVLLFAGGKQQMVKSLNSSFAAALSSITRFRESVRKMKEHNEFLMDSGLPMLSKPPKAVLEAEKIVREVLASHERVLRAAADAFPEEDYSRFVISFDLRELEAVHEFFR